MSYHLTHRIRIDLEKLAKSLPFVSSGKKRRTVSFGKDVINKQPELSGTGIKREFPYESLEAIPQDHYRKLKAAYIKNGMDGVKAYTEEVYSQQPQYKMVKKLDYKKLLKFILKLGALFLIAFIGWFLIGKLWDSL